MKACNGMSCRTSLSLAKRLVIDSDDEAAKPPESSKTGKHSAAKPVSGAPAARSSLPSDKPVSPAARRRDGSAGEGAPVPVLPLGRGKPGGKAAKPQRGNKKTKKPKEEDEEDEANEVNTIEDVHDFAMSWFEKLVLKTEGMKDRKIWRIPLKYLQ